VTVVDHHMTAIEQEGCISGMYSIDWSLSDFDCHADFSLPEIVLSGDHFWLFGRHVVAFVHSVFHYIHCC
jgi:hypothetical protein